MFSIVGRKRGRVPEGVSFAVLLVSQFIATTGFTFVMPFMPIYVRQLGVGSVGSAAAWAGFINGASGITMALVAPLWGRLADRIGRKAMLLRATFAGAVVICLMGFVTSPWQLLFLRLLQGTLTGTTPAATALVGSNSPSEKVGARLGQLQMVVFLAGGAGPAVGGLFAEVAGVRNSFFITSVLLAVSGAMILFGVVEERKAAVAGEGEAVEEREEKGSLPYRKLLPAMLALFVAQATIASVAVVLPGFLEKMSVAVSHLSGETGWIIGSSALAASLGSVLAGRLTPRVGTWPVVAGSLLAAGLFTLPQVWAGGVAELWALRVLTSFFLGGIIPAANLAVRDAAPAGRRATAFGFASSAVSLGFSAGPVGAGLIASALGFGDAFLLPGVMMLALGLVLSAMQGSSGLFGGHYHRKRWGPKSAS